MNVCNCYIIKLSLFTDDADDDDESDGDDDVDNNHVYDGDDDNVEYYEKTA
jgi:hypothetical protein